MPKTYACAKFYPIARDFLRILTNIGSAACTSCKNRLQNLLPQVSQVHAYRQSGGSVYSSKFGLTDSRHPTAIAQRRHQRWLCLQVSLAPSSCPARAAVAAIIVQQMIHYMLSPFHFAMWIVLNTISSCINLLQCYASHRLLKFVVLKLSSYFAWQLLHATLSVSFLNACYVGFGPVFFCTYEACNS